MLKILKKDDEYTQKPSEKAIFDIQQNKEPIYRTLYPHNSLSSHSSHLKFWRRPVSIGTSVIGLFYKDGVMIASDTGLSYGGRILQFKSAERVVKVNDQTLIGKLHYLVIQA